MTLEEANILRAAKREDLDELTRIMLDENAEANARVQHIDMLIRENESILRALRESRIQQVAIADFTMHKAFTREQERKARVTDELAR